MGHMLRSFRRRVGGAGRVVLRVATAAAMTAAAMAAVVPAAGAQARPSTTDMTCSQAMALVASKGAVVLNTGPNTFDRYVRDLAFCSGGEQLKPEWVPARDNRQCPIGYTCFVPSRDNFNSR